MKKILFMMSLLIASVSFAQTSSISGVVTYFFNSYQGDKPDLGAKVYIVNQKDIPDFDYEIVANFQRGKVTRSLYSYYLDDYNEDIETAKKYEGKKRFKDKYDLLLKNAEEKKEDVDKYYNQMIEYGVETVEKFKELDEKTLAQYLKISWGSNTIEKTIGNTGEYDIKVVPGIYFVYIVSKNRQSYALMTEIGGKTKCERVEAKENGYVDVSVNFDLH